MSFRKPQSALVAADVRGHARLEDHDTRPYLDDPKRMRVAVWVDTNDEVQLIRKHP